MTTKPWYIDSYERFFLYHPETGRMLGQFTSEEELQAKSVSLFGEKAEIRKNPKLKGMEILKPRSRLSVTPVSSSEFSEILKSGK